VVWLGVIVTDPRSFFETFLPQNLDGEVSEALPEDTVVAFHIEGSGGGSWQVVRDMSGSRVLPLDGSTKDCEMWCSVETFMRIIAGTLGSNRAFLSGDLRIAGDVGLALRLEGLLQHAA
jgi:putative sterol carrier protein